MMKLAFVFAGALALGIGCKPRPKYEVHWGPYCSTPAERMKLAEFVSHCSGWSADVCIKAVNDAACPMRFALHGNNAGFGAFAKFCDDAVPGEEQDTCKRGGFRATENACTPDSSGVAKASTLPK